VGISFNEQFPTRSFSSILVGSSIAFSTIVTVSADTTIAIQPIQNTITIPDTGETTAALSIFRIF